MGGKDRGKCELHVRAREAYIRIRIYIDGTSSSKDEDGESGGRRETHDVYGGPKDAESAGGRSEGENTSTRTEMVRRRRR